MNPSRLFILRPVATTLLMLAIVLVGLGAYRMLPVAALPQVDYPTIRVFTQYPGASPEVMLATVTAPLERQFGQMPGLLQMTSNSSGGTSAITLQFSLDLPLEAAEQSVQAAINAASSLLPSDLPASPVYNKVNPADTPVISLALTSHELPLTRLHDLADTRLAQKLAQVTGVGLVTIAGGQRPAVRVQANPAALAAHGLTLADIRTRIHAANVRSAKGSFDGAARTSTIDGNDQLASAQEYRQLVLRMEDGRALRLGDVAEVSEGAEDARLGAWADGQPAIVVNVMRQPGANVIDVVERIQARLPALRAALPGAVELRVLSDRTQTIRASVHDVQMELLFAIVLVVLVIYVFLRSAVATIIPAVAVPLSLIGTFAVMYLLDYSVNNLTLMALTIATGFVVDDAIVMIENIARYTEAGEPPMQAALKGAGQIGFTIISLTFSLVAVLIPLLFMSDVAGRLFREFAVTLAVSILVSAVISLTLTPMMCARLLHHTPEGEQPALHRAIGHLFERTIAAYARALDWVLARQGWTLLVAVATLVLTVLLYLVVPKGFFPLQDTGMLLGYTQAPASVSFSAMSRMQAQLAEALAQDEAVASVSAFAGNDGENAAMNSGRLHIALTPKETRDDVRTVMARLQARAAQLPAAPALYLQPVQELTIDTRNSPMPYQFTLQAADAETLQRGTRALVAALRPLPQFADLMDDLQTDGLQAWVEVDRDAAARLGVTMADVDDALYDAFGQRQVSTIFTQSNQYRVVLEVAPQWQNGLEALRALHVSGSSGAPVPLASFARMEERHTTLAQNRLGQFPVATVSFAPAEGVSLGEAVDALRQTAAQVLPASIQMELQGAALAFRASLGHTLWLVLAAVLTMYIVLGVLYESAIHPVTILSTLPTATIGALLALLVAGSELTMIAVIGIILLIGIVKKNAIMMIDFALDAERQQGMNPFDAIRQACLLRFRPILMTTLAALFGALPLMLGGGMGSELRQPLGLTLVGGLLVSQVLTLFTTPVIYLWFDRLGARVRRLARRQDGAA